MFYTCYLKLPSSADISICCSTTVPVDSLHILASFKLANISTILSFRRGDNFNCLVVFDDRYISKVVDAGIVEEVEDGLVLALA